ncbi:MAG: TatD family hydrolase [Flavobacteriales bacterium]
MSFHLIDTHTHLYLDAFNDDRDAMISRALEAGVTRMLLPNIDINSIAGMHALCDAYPHNCYPMMGLHPCDVQENFRDVLSDMDALFEHRKYVAVGETGIDLYWDKTTLAQQIESFEIQIEWAKKRDLPIVIHARDSYNEIFEVLDRLNDDRLRGVFHCFTGNLQQAHKIMDYGGFMMGIGGVLTYEKSGLAEVVKDIPMEFLMLETDSPFLTPKPYRGKRNESTYVKFVAEKLSEIKQLSLQEIARITAANAESMFRLESYSHSALK